MMGLEKYLKKMARGSSLEDGVMKLNQLTDAGARMASVEMIRHIVNKKVIDIGDYARVVHEKVLSVEDKVQDLGDTTINVVDDKVKMVIAGTQVCLASHQHHH
jgi:hypothetical protein